MTIQEILPDLFFIQRGYLNANHFVYRGDVPELIDTGYASGFSETEQYLRDLGVSVEAVGRIINTHTHSDHIGGNGPIQHHSGCEIAMHYIGQHFVNHGNSWAMWWDYAGHQTDNFTVQTGLRDGQVVEIGPYSFEVIETPGHAVDGLVLYYQPEKLLISSDALWSHDVPTMLERVAGSRTVFDGLTSLSRLAQLDATRIYPGHGAPFTDLHDAIAQSRTKFELYLRDRMRLGLDATKKMLVYSVLMHQPIQREALYRVLLDTMWYPETIDFYFEGAYPAKFDELVDKFLRRGIFVIEDGFIRTTVKP